MMGFAEFLDRCRSIRYERSAVVTEFGKPMNCYGFVYWYYELCRGIGLETFDVESFDDVRCVRYEAVSEPQNGDVVDIRTVGGDYAYHVGIYMNGYVHHFGHNGPEVKDVERVPHMIKGYYHVIESQKRDIQGR